MRRLGLLLLLAGGAGAGDDPLFAEIEEEIRARKEGGRGDEALALEAEVAAVRARASDGAGTGPEAHLVTAQRETRPPGEVRVRVTATGRPVVLVLASDAHVRWIVDKAEGVELRRVYTAGWDASVWVPARCPLERLLDIDPREKGLESAVEAGLRCPVWTTLAAAGKEPVVVGPGNPEWLAQRARTDLRLLHWRVTRGRRAAAREAVKEVRLVALRRWLDTSGKSPTPAVSLCEWTPLGPLLAGQVDLPSQYGAATAAVRDDARGHLYLLRHALPIRHELPSGPPEVLNVPHTLPDPRERAPSALAIDTRRDRLLLATRQFLYALDLKSREWSVIEDMDLVEAAGMAYDGQRDAVLCLEYGEDGVLRIHHFSPENGRHLGEVPVRMSPLPGRRPLVASCVKGNLVFLMPPPADPPRDAEETRAFVVEPHTGEVLFTSRTMAWEDFSPLGPAGLEERWNTLLVKDEAKAGRAMREIAGQGDAAVALLARRLAPEPRGAEDFRRWVAELSHDDALVRSLAQQRLVEAGPSAGEFLASLDQQELQPEARRRVASALKAVGGAALLQRNMRAVRVLEWIETPAAEALLRELAEKGEAKRRAAAREAQARMDLPPR